MKLYATVEAQKLENGKYKTVRKSQGSNDQINVFISVDDDKNPRFVLFVNDNKDGSTRLSLIDHTKPFPKNELWRLNTTKDIQQKGEKQKGEQLNKCKKCGHDITAGQVSQTLCHDCLVALGY